jgi:hypothetical protein
MTPEVETAIAEIQRAFPEHPVRTLEDGQGGARVIVEDLPIGDRFDPTTSWVGFPIGFQYPRAQVYPHYVRPDLRRRDGQPHTAPVHPGQTMPGFDESALMVSRGSNRWNPATDTALLKLLRVLEWLQECA